MLPFQICGALLLAAMLGVIVIAKKPRDPETPPRERI